MLKLYQDFSKSDKQLINTAKAHFIKLKKEKMPVIPFCFISKQSSMPQLLSLPALNMDDELPLIDQLWQKASSKHLNKNIASFLVAFDAYVMDKEEIDKDALVLILQKDDGTQIQINIPYVEDGGELVFGKSWTSST